MFPKSEGSVPYVVQFCLQPGGDAPGVRCDGAGVSSAPGGVSHPWLLPCGQPAGLSFGAARHALSPDRGDGDGSAGPRALCDLWRCGQPAQRLFGLDPRTAVFAGQNRSGRLYPGCFSGKHRPFGLGFSPKHQREHRICPPHRPGSGSHLQCFFRHRPQPGIGRRGKAGRQARPPGPGQRVQKPHHPGDRFGAALCHLRHPPAPDGRQGAGFPGRDGLAPSPSGHRGGVPVGGRGEKALPHPVGRRRQAALAPRDNAPSGGGAGLSRRSPDRLSGDVRHPYGGEFLYHGGKHGQ